MSAPKRWIDDVAAHPGGRPRAPSDATPVERDLLRSGLSVDPPPGAQGKVWLSILAQVPPLPPGGAPPPPPAAGAASAAGKAGAAAKGALAAKGGAAVAGAAGASLLKSALIGAGSAVAVIFTYSAVTPPASTDAPRPPPAAAAEQRGPLQAQTPAGPTRPGAAPEAPAPPPAIEAAPSASPTAERRAAVTMGGDAPRPAASVTAPPTTPPAAAAEAAERETTIKEEGRLMGLAADTLHRGDAAGALAQLELIQARFPRGGLVLEREVRIIEALARAGRGAEASARAAAFLKAHPDSVLTYRVQPYVR